MLTSKFHMERYTRLKYGLLSTALHVNVTMRILDSAALRQQRTENIVGTSIKYRLNIRIRGPICEQIVSILCATNFLKSSSVHILS